MPAAFRRLGFASRSALEDHPVPAASSIQVPDIRQDRGQGPSAVSPMAADASRQQLQQESQQQNPAQQQQQQQPSVPAGRQRRRSQQQQEPLATTSPDSRLWPLSWQQQGQPSTPLGRSSRSPTHAAAAAGGDAAAEPPLTEIEAATASHCKSVCASAYDILKSQCSYDRLCQQFSKLLESDGRVNWSSCPGRQEANLAKNRYNDVLPFDSNRVVLPLPGSNGSGGSSRACTSPSPTGAAAAAGVGVPGVLASAAAAAGDGQGDYINASYIQDPSRHCLHPCNYIATQGPLPGTVVDFWRMVAHTNTSAVVMLSTAEDLERQRCAPYYPVAEKAVLQLPGISVRCVYKAQLAPCLTMRQLELAVADSGEQRWINHYHYDAWPDYGVPASTEHLRQLCHALDDCRRIGCHITVHCSAGIGRTGTFLAIDMLLQRLLWLKLQVQQSLSVATITSVLNVPALVAALRQQRAGMVQTMDQYSCVYSVVMEQLLSYESELSEILQAAPAGALPAAEVTGASSSSSGAAQGTAGAGSSSGGMPAAANRTPQTAAGVGTDAAAPRGAAASAAAAVGCIPRALPAADRHGAAGVKLQATPCATAL